MSIEVNEVLRQPYQHNSTPKDQTLMREDLKTWVKRFFFISMPINKKQIDAEMHREMKKIKVSDGYDILKNSVHYEAFLSENDRIDRDIQAAVKAAEMRSPVENILFNFKFFIEQYIPKIKITIN